MTVLAHFQNAGALVSKLVRMLFGTSPYSSYFGIVRIRIKKEPVKTYIG
jgi:hypothetical protein